MTTATVIKEKHLTGEAYIFRGLVHYHRGAIWWYVGRRGAGEVAKHPTSWFARNKKWSETLHETSEPATTVMPHLLQQSHTSQKSL